MHYTKPEHIQVLDKLRKAYNIVYKVLAEYSILHEECKVYFTIINKHILLIKLIGRPDKYFVIKYLESLHLILNKLEKDQKLNIIIDINDADFMVRKEHDIFDFQLAPPRDNIVFVSKQRDQSVYANLFYNNNDRQKTYDSVNDLEQAILSHTQHTPENPELLSKEELLYHYQKLAKELEKEKAGIRHLQQQISTTLAQQKNETKQAKPHEDDVTLPIHTQIKNALNEFIVLKNKYRQLDEQFEKNVNDRVVEIKEQEAGLRAIFNSIEVIMWFIDTDYVLKVFNNNFVSHISTHYNAVPKIGMNVLHEAAFSTQYNAIKARIEKAKSGKEEKYIDFYKEGDEIVKVVESKIFPVIISGKPAGVACLTEDITESYFDKEHIKTNQQLISSINKNITEAIYRSEPNKGLVYVNDAFVKMFGYENKAEVMQNSSLNLYENPKERKKLGDLLIRKKEYRNVEVKFRKKNGDIFTGLLSSMLTIGEDGKTYFDGAIRDITTLKSTQQKLRDQNSQLKKLNSELDSFVYSASHDLKAPLSSIKGLIHIAKTEKDIKEMANYLDMMDKSVDKLDSFIQDIIHLSRNVRQSLQKEKIDFECLLQEVLDNFKYLDNYKHIRFTLVIDNKYPFYSDKKRIAVVLNNLISNAIRYYNPIAKLPTIEIVIHCDQSLATITISDNGLGIEEKYQKKIFEMFFRASEISKGSGIGLYIVKETVQKLKGEINLHSKKGAGSTFIVTIANLKR